MSRYLCSLSCPQHILSNISAGQVQRLDPNKAFLA